MPPLTEYELERQANIERNRRILKELGLYDGLEVAPSRAKAVSIDIFLYNAKLALSNICLC